MGETLSIAKRMAYASAAFALTIVGLPLYVFVPKFYTDIVGVNVATVGTLILAARIFDAVTDPAIGLWSDATRSRWGRRRPFVALASIPLSLALVALLAPPDLSAGAAVVWFACSLFGVYLFWTLVAVPYEALGIEITVSYDERTSVIGLREGIALVGILVAVITPPLLADVFELDGEAGERAKMKIYALLYAPLTIATCFWCAWTLTERGERPRSKRPLRQRLSKVFANRPYLVLVGSFALGGIGANLPAALILYYVRYVIGSEHAEEFLVLYMVTGVLCVPLWLWLARRYEKRTAWLAAMGMHVAVYAFTFFLGPGDETLFLVTVLLAGVPFGGLMTLPSAMQADAVDYGEVLSGEREEGLYVGLWNVARKLAGAVGVGVALWVLGNRGYVPNVEQTEGVRTTLRVLYCLVPCVFNGLTFLLVLGYPIDRRRHDEIRARTG